MDEQQILLYLLDNKTINRQEAMEILGFKKSKIHELFALLMKAQLIEQKGKGRATYYQLNPNTND